MKHVITILLFAHATAIAGSLTGHCTANGEYPNESRETTNEKCWSFLVTIESLGVNSSIRENQR